MAIKQHEEIIAASEDARPLSVSAKTRERLLGTNTSLIIADLICKRSVQLHLQTGATDNEVMNDIKILSSKGGSQRSLEVLDAIDAFHNGNMLRSPTDISEGINDFVESYKGDGVLVVRNVNLSGRISKHCSGIVGQLTAGINRSDFPQLLLIGHAGTLPPASRQPNETALSALLDMTAVTTEVAVGGVIAYGAENYYGFR